GGRGGRGRRRGRGGLLALAGGQRERAGQREQSGRPERRQAGHHFAPARMIGWCAIRPSVAITERISAYCAGSMNRLLSANERWQPIVVAAVCLQLASSDV